MIIRWILFLLGVLLFAMWDISGASFLPSWISIRLIVPFAFFCFFTERYRHAFIALFVGAAVQDIFRWDGFDSALLRWTIIYGLMQWLAERFLTNRSLYVVCFLVLAFQSLDWFSAWMLSGIGIVLGFSSSFSLPDHWISILVWEVLLTVIGYGIISWSDGRLVRFKSKGYGS
ncbi:MAG: hypothetical protein KC582_01860 [Candidatus Magasanikbacteria bacterium]|nr:hypothetical protein [Candidatus Magasanikbacteria bacterium]MCA9389398.1 hypothetical protein [Candidatus Magasanikbacteria bacterium]MCA9390976.1 hypothetical protein [Candidatus Magasanikbacteria bacterium]USN52006.1 MAG: hypothetical protein H6759_03150 [Candidatus Nomurabacteria bacterium]HPF95266.1 hypothetical protein [bacterium]